MVELKPDKSTMNTTTIAIKSNSTIIILPYLSFNIVHISIVGSGGYIKVLKLLFGIGIIEEIVNK